MLVALTRPPTSALARCELTHLERVPIDVTLARAQHEAYADLLAMLGARVVSLPEQPDLPDAVFVEDTAVVLDEIAVLARPGAASRQAEVDAIEPALAPYRAVRRIEAPGTLDGGDVLGVGRILYVGRSTRTNDAGIAQLTRVVERYGYRVRTVQVSGCLHLKSACSHIGDGTVLVNGSWIDTAALADAALLEVDRAEPHAANAVLVNDAILMAGDAPRTTDLVRSSGRRVVTVDLSELRKAEAAGTCMSLLFAERPAG